jgi:hypothetical protein
VPGSLSFLIRAAAYLFLVGIVLVVASPIPALSRRFPRLYLLGFLLSVVSVFLVLAGALLLH